MALNYPDYTTESDASVYKGNLDEYATGHFAGREAATPNMTVAVGAGRLMYQGALVVQTAQATGTITAPSVNPRIDRVVIDPSDGSISVVTGSEAASPVAPDITAGFLPCCQVLLQTSTTQITNSIITDERVPGQPSHEVGTFTPTIQDGSLSDAEGQTYSLQDGYYIKIGKLVFVHGRIVVTSFGTLDGTSYRLAGLPFTAVSGKSQQPGIITINSASGLTITAGHNLTALISPNATNAQIHLWDATTGTSQLVSADVGTTAAFGFSGVYESA